MAKTNQIVNWRNLIPDAESYAELMNIYEWKSATALTITKTQKAKKAIIKRKGKKIGEVPFEFNGELKDAPIPMSNEIAAEMMKAFKGKQPELEPVKNDASLNHASLLCRLFERMIAASK